MSKISANKIESSEQGQGHTFRQWFISILANSTLLSCGLQIGWTLPMTKVLQSENSPTGYPLSDTDMSWIASIMCLAAFVGVHLSSIAAERFGRRTAVILIAIPQTLCWILKFSSANIIILMVARICSGLSSGSCFNIIPIYVKEISQDNIRGLTGSLMLLFQNIGYLSMYILGAYLDYFTVLDIVVWLPFATILLMWKAPESPSYLVKVGKIEEARTTIAWLRGLNENNKEVDNEIINLNNEKSAAEAMPPVSYISLFKEKSWRSLILLMLSIMTIGSCNGCFVILTYASSILAVSGMTINAELLAMTFPTVMIVCGFISMTCVERFGRKMVMAITNFLLSSSMFALGVVIHMQYKGINVPGWLPAVFMMTAVAGYAGGAGPVPYVMLSEMFNFQIKAKVLSMIVSYTWFINFVQLLGYSPIAASLGVHTAFYGFGALNFFAFLIAVLILPETKGKSPEQIEARFR
ncbi:sugar transporter domain-containing protein [Phthorimaea operculella]|nr:sugar transporter domain-containing protein [Phthorimaea operculella]